MNAREDFAAKLVQLAPQLRNCVSSGGGQWTLPTDLSR
jgi:hypothetical protein